MSKQKRNFIIVTSLSVILAIMLTVFFVTKEKDSKKTSEKQKNNSDTSTINVESIDIEDNNTESDINNSDEELVFLEPDETEADKILENNKNTSSVDTSSTSETDESDVSDDNTQSFEEGKKELEDEALEYLKKHNIDIKTAGETGEICPNCSKKIWNPDKYGLCIPGMPEDYENSGYCLGTCGISLE